MCPTMDRSIFSFQVSQEPSYLSGIERQHQNQLCDQLGGSQRGKKMSPFCWGWGIFWSCNSRAAFPITLACFDKPYCLQASFLLSCMATVRWRASGKDPSEGGREILIKQLFLWIPCLILPRLFF